MVKVRSILIMWPYLLCSSNVDAEEAEHEKNGGEPHPSSTGDNENPYAFSHGAPVQWALLLELRRSAGTRRALVRRRPARRADQGQPGRISRVGRTAAVSSSQEPLHPAVPSRCVVLSWYSRLLQPSDGLLSTLRRRPESV